MEHAACMHVQGESFSVNPTPAQARGTRQQRVTAAQASPEIGRRYSQFRTSTLRYRDEAVSTSDQTSSTLAYCSGSIQQHFPNCSPYDPVPVIVVVGMDQPIFYRIPVHCTALPSHPDNFFYNTGSKLRVPL